MAAAMVSMAEAVKQKNNGRQSTEPTSTKPTDTKDDVQVPNSNLAQL